MICTIYKITNLINNKPYVGQTWKDDLQEYFKKSHVYVKGRVKLYRAIHKYGANHFSIEPIAYALSQESADSTEDSFIIKYDSIKCGYNIRRGGSRGLHSEETKRKISKAGLGRKHSTEAKHKMSLSHSGKRLSKQTKEKMSKAKVGKRVSPKTEFKKGHISNRMFTAEQEAMIVNRYHKLKSSYKVADIFGCNSSTILNIVKRHIQRC